MNASDALAELAEHYLDISCRADPFYATQLGIPGYDHLLRDPSLEAEAGIRAQLVRVRESAERLDDADLSTTERVTRDMLAFRATSGVATIDANLAEFAVDPGYTGPQVGLLGQLPKSLLPDGDAVDAFVARLEAVPTDGSRPGTYYINTHSPETKSRHESEGLAFHEGVSGHHLQFPISQQIERLPTFRAAGYIPAYAEGWAMYTERLADELGLYSSELARLGMLTFDSWRAVGLVVDTGIHALGWTRQQAIDFAADRCALALDNIISEVDRYIAWPGDRPAAT